MLEIKHNFSWANPSGTVSGVLAVLGAPSPDRENSRPKSKSPILTKVYGKLVSHKLSIFCEKCVFSPAAQFAYRNCTDALLIISHQLQKSLDTGMQYYIVQLGFCAAFDRVSQSGLLFKLKSIGVGGCVWFICKKFLSNRRQRVVVDGATSELIPIVSGVPQGSVLGRLFILYTSESFELVENRLYPYADAYTLHITDRPAIAASLNRDLARIQEWCNTAITSA